MGIAQIESGGESAGIGGTLTLLLNRFSGVCIIWIPGYYGITGNEISDAKAQQVVGGVIQIRNWTGVVLCLSQARIA